MKFFIDTADINEIKEILNYGIIDGVTTNPSLIAKVTNDKKDIFDILRDITNIISGDVSAEVISSNYESMIKEGEKLSKIAKNICIKLPMTFPGIKACNYFARNNIKTNVTLCFSPAQAIIAAKAGASYVSPFIGRLDDISLKGTELIKDIATIFNNYPNFKTEILSASIRNVNHVIDVAKYGSHVATIPQKILLSMIKHPLTDKAIDIFNNDAQKTNQKIL